MFLKRQDHRIGLIGGIILAGLTLAAGISVFVVMQRQAESMLSKSLESLLQNNVRVFESQIDLALGNTRTVATRPFVISNLQLLESDPGNAAGPTELQRIAKSFLPTGFTAVSYYDVRGNEVARAGQFSQTHDLRVPLKTNNRAFLLWDGQFILHAGMDILNPLGSRVGTVLTETSLPLLTRALADVVSIGKTGDFAVCAPLQGDEKNMDCFPSRISGKVFKRFARAVEGKPLPMHYALNGETGILFTQDYRREQVVAAYAPVGAFGLGMVIKIDREELYQPVTGQLKFIAPLLAALVMVGMLLLNFLVRPLVRKLVESEQVFRRLFEDANDPNLLIKNGCFVECNAATLQLLGYGSKLEFLNYSPSKVSPACQADGRSSDEKAAEMIAIGLREGHHRFEWIHARADGSTIPIEVTLTPITVGGEVILHTLWRDISAHKQAGEEIRQLNANLERRVLERTTELQAANQELEAFSYSVSHDLRAPLRAIDGFSQAVLEDYADKLDDQGKDYLNRVRTATQRMGHLIDDMLTLSRVTRAEMLRATVDLSALAADVIAELQKSEPLRRVDCHIESGLVAEGDAQLLRVALVNLLGNAWKFTGKTANAKIEFGAASVPDTGNAPIPDTQDAPDFAPSFFVRDNGAGYDMSYAGKLFGAFQRLHLASDFPGTGIGLATVQRIVHRHGGRVWAEGAVGKGATFYFTL